MTDHSPGLSNFFAQAAKLPLLTAAQEVKLSAARDRGDHAARNALVNHNIRLAINIAKRYRNHGLDFEDLVQEAVVGLHRAADKFDGARGFRFSTYATWWINHQLQRAVQNTGATIRTPGHILARRNKINRYLTTHPDATTEQLAAHAECRPDQVEDALNTTRVVASLDTMLADGDGSAYDIFADPNAIHPEDAADADDNGELRSALASLLEREREVLELRFGFNGYPRTQAEVGEQLGIAAHVVRRTERVALTKLRGLMDGTIVSGSGDEPPEARRGNSSFARPGIVAAPTCVRAEPR